MLFAAAHQMGRDPSWSSEEVERGVEYYARVGFGDGSRPRTGLPLKRVKQGDATVVTRQQWHFSMDRKVKPKVSRDRLCCPRVSLKVTTKVDRFTCQHIKNIDGETPVEK